MKIRPLFIYLGLFVVTVLLIVMFSGESEKEVNPHAGMNQGEMPDDDIHRGMNPGLNSAPGSGNVNTEFKNKIASLEEKIAENPEDTASIKIYAEMLASAHQVEKSIELFNSILEIDPNRVDVMLTLSFIEYNRSNFKQAAEYTETILKIAPSNPEAFYNKGAIEAALGNKDEAKKTWEELIKKIPDSEAAKIAKSSLTKL